MTRFSTSKVKSGPSSGLSLRHKSEKDSELVSELTDELIALIDKHEDRYELYAQVIKNSINGEQKA